MAKDVNFTLAGWLHTQLNRYIAEGADGPDESKRPTGIVLYDGVRADRTAILEIACLPGKALNARELAERFEGEAQRHANGVGGVVQFSVEVAFAGEGIDNKRYPFRRAGQDEVVDALGGSADAKGQHAQILRHNEALMKIVVTGQESMFSAMNGILQHMTEMNASLRKENDAARDSIYEMALRQVEEDREARAKELEYQRRTETQKMLLSLAPSLINKVVGKPILPETGVRTAALEALKGSITPDQINQLLPVLSGVLKPEQMAALMELMMPSDPSKQMAEGSDSNG